MEQRTLLSAGSLDPTFGNGGIVLGQERPVGFGLATAVDPKTGDIIEAGTQDPSELSPTSVVLQRYSSTGQLDLSFGTNGTASNTNFGGNPGEVVVEPNGDILVTASSETSEPFAIYTELARFTASGNPDSNFGFDGMLQIGSPSLAFDGGGFLLLPNGNIVITGSVTAGSSTTSALEELNPDGSVDTSFGNDGVTTGAPGTVSAVTLDSSNRLVAVGATPANSQDQTTGFVERFTAAGQLDSSFGNVGSTFIPGVSSLLQNVFVESNGEIEAIGGLSLISPVLLYHFTPSGAVDTSFGNDSSGEVTVPLGRYETTFQPDGKILLGGSIVTQDGLVSTAALARVNPDGSLDTSFGTAGYADFGSGYGAMSAAGAISLQPDGKIILGNTYTDPPIAMGMDLDPTRLNANGTPDTSFGVDGTAGGRPLFTTGDALAELSDGQTLVAGAVTVGGVQGIYLRRYDADGSLDSSFAPGLGYGGASGYVFIAAPSQFSYGSPDVIRLILDSSGRILMGAANYGLFRLNPSGTFDTGFGIGGFVAVTGLLDFTLAPNGQIVTTSGTDTVSRFNTNGSVDTTFGSGGSVSVPTSSGPVAVQPNEEILVGGSQSDPDTGYFGGSTNDLAVTRLNVNGSVDTTFGTAGTSTANYNKFDPDDDLENYSEVLSLTVLPNGNILAGGGAQQQAADGQTGLTAAEFLPNGKIDTAFASGGEIAPYFVGDSFYYQGFTLASTIVQPNGSIVFSGGFTDDSGTGFYVIRFTAAGIADSSFGSDGEVTMQFGEPSTQGANPDDYILSAAAAPRGNLIVVGNAPDPSTSDGSGIALARYNLGLGTVVGTVFNDSNGDGIRESGETGIAGQTVYADLAGTGSYQYGDPETITDSNGNYTLSGLPLGPLVIRQILLSGQRQSFPMGIGEHVTLGANAVTNVNFGTTTDVYVSGDVFNDANLNGKQDSTETGIGGWRVFADLNNDDKFESSEPSALTNSNGTFYFTDLAAGTYVFRVLPASGWHQTYPTDSFGQHVTLASGGISPWVHFGFAQNAVPSASISGSVFDDLNDNGKQNTGEAGLEGWTVYLDLSNSGSLTGNDPVTKTDANGDFSFMGLSAGNYIVRVIRPAGWTQTTPSNNFGWHITLAAHGAATGLLFGEHQ